MYLEVIKEKPSTITQPNPILFIHGMWHAAWCWTEYFLPYFSQRGYLAYALSLRGHGKSEGNKQLRWSSLNDYVSDVAHVVNQMEKPPILVGHSMGGMIVQKYLETNKTPAAVFLASTPPKGVLATTTRTFFRHPLSVIKTSLTLSMSPIVSTAELAHEAFFSTDMQKETVMKYFLQLQDESFRAYIDMLVLNLPNIRQIESPVLVLGAKNDMMISPKEIEATARAYNVKAEFFDHMAHDMMLEDRWHEVADRMLDWLDIHNL